MVSGYQSEYEQSFAGRRNRYIDRSAAEQMVDTSGVEWITELHDARRRAAENKMRSRGDHFSRDHLLQIPSQATRFWEPYEANPQPSGTIYGATPNVAFRQNGTIVPDTIRYPAVKMITNHHEYATPVVTRDHPALELMRDDQRPEVVISVGQQTDDHSRQLSSIKYPVLYAPTKCSQSTQTNSLLSAENLPLRPAGITQAGSTIEGGVGSAEIYPADVVGASPNNAARLDILRKAKYFDAKDFASSTTPLLRSMPRSLSTRSLNRSQDRRSGFSPVRYDRRPSTSIPTYEADLQKVRASSGNLKLQQGRADNTEQVPDHRQAGFDRRAKLGGTLNNGVARPSRRSDPISQEPPSSFRNDIHHGQAPSVGGQTIVPTVNSDRGYERRSSGNGFSALRTPIREPSPVAKVSDSSLRRPSSQQDFSITRLGRNPLSGGKDHFSAWIDL